MTDAPTITHDSCPCCGQTWPAGRDRLDARRMAYEFITNASQQERRLLDFLLDHFGEFKTYPQTIAAMWQLDPSGGPENPINVISQMVSRFQGRLHRAGLTVDRKRGFGLRLRWIHAEEADSTGSAPA